MGSPTKISDIKLYQKPQDSFITTLITRRISRVITFLLLKYDSKVTPNQISILSLFLAILACVLFIYTNYYIRILGVLLLQFAFALDCSDGEVARYKNMGSKFGAWFDSVSDRFKEILMFISIAYIWFLRHQNSHVLIIGALTIIMWLFIGYLREAKKSSWPIDRKAEFFITKNIYIGTVDMTIFFVCFAVVLKIELYILYFFLIISLPMLIKQVISAWNLSKISKY